MVLKMIDNRLDAGYLPLVWRDNKLEILDQRCLPERLEYYSINSFTDTCFAIKDMVVRGAPSIGGVTAVYGFALESCRVVALSLMRTTTGELKLATYDQLFPTKAALLNLKTTNTQALNAELVILPTMCLT